MKPVKESKGATAMESSAATETGGSLMDKIDGLERERDIRRKSLRRELDRLLDLRRAVSDELEFVELEIEARLSAAISATVRPSVKKEEPSKPKPARKPSGTLKGISPHPVVPVKDSVQKDGVVCLIDGEKRKMLHRYLKAKYQITPEQYRVHFNLPYSYPMTAPGYSESQSKAVKKAVKEGHLSPYGHGTARTMANEDA